MANELGFDGFAGLDEAKAESPPPLEFGYRNWRGEIRRRKVFPEKLWHGATTHHLEPQWLLRGVDAATGQVRDFAIRDMDSKSGPGDCPTIDAIRRSSNPDDLEPELKERIMREGLNVSPAFRTAADIEAATPIGTPAPAADDEGFAGHVSPRGCWDSNDADQLFDEVQEWSERTFATREVRGPRGPLKHLAKEVLVELLGHSAADLAKLLDTPTRKDADPGDLSELADVQILLCDALWRSGKTWNDLVEAALGKMVVNRHRSYPKAEGDEIREHDRTGEAAAIAIREGRANSKSTAHTAVAVLAAGGSVGNFNEKTKAIFDEVQDLTPEQAKYVAETAALRLAARRQVEASLPDTPLPDLIAKAGGPAPACNLGDVEFKGDSARILRELDEKAAYEAGLEP